MGNNVMKLETSRSINFEGADLKVHGSNMKNKSVRDNSGLGFIIQGDSKLLPGFQWPIVFKPEARKKLLKGYESSTQKMLLSVKLILQIAKLTSWSK
jgi:hypothetical protein